MGSDNPERVTYFAETDARNRRVPFGIKAKDRSRHMYVIGKTGMGKSTLLENLAIQDIRNGEGMVFIDPHGKTADLFLDYIPKERVKDVMYFAPFDSDFPISFNVMEDVGYDKRHLVMSGLMSAFKKIWLDAWSARMEYILGNTLLALLEYPEATLLSINRMFSDKKYREKVVGNVTDPTVRSFWVDEFAKYTDRFAAEATPAIQNKIGQFTSNPIIRNIIGQPYSSFDPRKMMDERKIIIINLSKGRIGEINANLLGGMLITKIYLAAMSRADVSEEELKSLPNMYLYVDEFQSFANESFADILSEARKYKLNLTVAHQYIAQMSEEVRDAVFGNVGTMISFRVGAYDAEVLEKEFAPVFTEEDMVNLGFAQTYLKLMIDGVTSPPFSATTLPPFEPPAVSHRDEVIKSSRDIYAQTRAVVEDNIQNWHAGHDNVSGSSQPKQEKKQEKKKEQDRSTGNKTDSAPGKGFDKKRNKDQPNKKEDKKFAPSKNKQTNNKETVKKGGNVFDPKKKAPPPEDDELSPAEELQRGLGKDVANERRSIPEARGGDERSSLKEALAAVASRRKKENSSDHHKKPEEDVDAGSEEGVGDDQGVNNEGVKQAESKSSAGSDHIENKDDKVTENNFSKEQENEKKKKDDGGDRNESSSFKQQKSAGSSKGPLSEIPEDELKKILQVDEEER